MAAVTNPHSLKKRKLRNSMLLAGAFSEKYSEWCKETAKRHKKRRQQRTRKKHGRSSCSDACALKD
jgi:hypothetical protein